MQRSNDYSPARVADRLAIQDLEYRWCRAVDRRDYAAIPELFHPDAYDDHGAYKGDVTGLIEWLRARHQSVMFSMHQMTNVLVDFADDDNALVEIYLTVVQRYAPGHAGGMAEFVRTPMGDHSHVDLVSRARYVDRVQRRDGAWKVLKRTFVPEWRQITASEIEVGGTSAASPARRGLDDLVFIECAAMGIAHSSVEGQP